MYSIFLIENLTTPSPAASFSGTNDINLTAANTINILEIDNILSPEIGYYVKFMGEFYPIVSFAYYPYFRFYSIKVSGNPPTAFYSSVNWSIHTRTNTTNSVKLDTEDIEIETTFAVSDIADSRTTRRKRLSKTTIKLYYQRRVHHTL